MSGWICQWKPFWIPVGDSRRKAYIEEWFYAASDAPTNPAEMKECFTKLERPDVAPPAPGPQDTASSWDNVEAPLPPRPRGQVTSTHPLPTCSAPERLKLPFPTGDILSGYADDVTSDNDLFTSWAKIEPEALLALDMVDARRAAAEYREEARQFFADAPKLTDVQTLSQPNKNVSVSTIGTQDLDEETQTLS